jgi:hypothetical protein
MTGKGLNLWRKLVGVVVPLTNYLLVMGILDCLMMFIVMLIDG